MLDRRSRLSYTVNDYFHSYLDYVDGNIKYIVPLSVFKSVLRDYLCNMVHLIIDESKEVRLPARMGYLSVVKKKPIKYNHVYLNVDFKETRLRGKTIYHMNEHSDGFNYKFYWSKRNMLISNKTMYELVMSRDNKRYLAQAIKVNKKDYLEKR